MPVRVPVPVVGTHPNALLHYAKALTSLHELALGYLDSLRANPNNGEKRVLRVGARVCECSYHGGRPVQMSYTRPSCNHFGVPGGGGSGQWPSGVRVRSGSASEQSPLVPLQP